MNILKDITVDQRVTANAFYGDGSHLTGITKAMVGLGNVDNTSDATKTVLASQNVSYTLNVKQFGAIGNGIADDTAAIQAARDYIAAQTTKSVLIFPPGIYRYSASPNWAVKDIVVEARGEVRLRYFGTNDAVIFDGGSSDIDNVRFKGFIVEAPWDAKNAVYVHKVHRSFFDFDVRGCGTLYAGLFVGFAVCDEFRIKVSASSDGSWYQGNAIPNYGIKIYQASSASACFCTFIHPIIEYCQHGISITKGGGNAFVGGTIENCINWGMRIEAGADRNRFIGTDFESTPFGGQPLWDYDITCEGELNFFNCETCFSFIFGDNSFQNTIDGGKHNKIKLNASSHRNIVCNTTFNYRGWVSTYEAMQNLGVDNRFRDNYDYTLAQWDPWHTDAELRIGSPDLQKSLRLVSKNSPGLNAIYSAAPYAVPDDVHQSATRISFPTAGNYQEISLDYSHWYAQRVGDDPSLITDWISGLKLDIYGNVTIANRLGIGGSAFAPLHVSGKAIIGGQNATEAGYFLIPATGNNALFLSTDCSVSADIGSTICLGARYNNANNYQIAYGSIGGFKENATDSNTDGYLGFFTSNNTAHDSLLRMQIMSNGDVNIGGTINAGQINVPYIFLQSPVESRPGGVNAATEPLLHLSRVGTSSYAYREDAEFRLGHGSGTLSGSRLDLYINSVTNTSGHPDMLAMTWYYNGDAVTTGNITADTFFGDGSYLTGITEAQVSGLVTDLSLKAPLASPTFTGNITNNTGLSAGGITINATSYPNLIFEANGVTKGGLQYYNGGLNFFEGGIDFALFIKDNGKVGINTGSPSEQLDVNGNVKATAFIGSGANLTGINIHDPVTIVTANGLSLHWQELSMGLASAGVTGALSGTDWSTFNGKQNSLGFTPENAANKNQVNGYPSLDSGGKIPLSQLPATTIANTWVVASQAAMLALSASPGDLAVRTDVNNTYILTTSPASVLANWQQLLVPSNAVTSVFSRTGDVYAVANDYTADQIDDTATTKKFVSATQIGNWNTAYGWGNHALAGYASASSLTTHANLTTTAHGGIVASTDSRLSDARSASDVYSWAKASSKPSYAATEIDASTTLMLLGRIASGAGKVQQLTAAQTISLILPSTGIVKVTAGVASYITDSSSHWNAAYSWGDHALVGYLTGITKAMIEAQLTGVISSHSHTASAGATLTRGTGLTGSNYNGSVPTTWAVDLGTSHSQAAYGDHTHTGTFEPTLLRYSVAFNTADLVSGSESGGTVSISGASKGDPVIVSHTGVSRGLWACKGFVTATDTVIFSLRNEAGDNDSLIGDVHIIVVKY